MRIVSYGERLPVKQRRHQKAISRAKKNGEPSSANNRVPLAWQSSYTLANENHQSQSLLTESSRQAYRRILVPSSIGSASGPPYIPSSNNNSTDASCGASCKASMAVGYVTAGLVALSIICSAGFFLKDRIASIFSKAKEKICSCIDRQRTNQLMGN